MTTSESPYIDAWHCRQLGIITVGNQSSKSLWPSVKKAIRNCLDNRHDFGPSACQRIFVTQGFIDSYQGEVVNMARPENRPPPVEPEEPAYEPADEPSDRDMPPIDSDCRCGHRQKGHILPYGRCQSGLTSDHRCPCETYRPVNPIPPPIDPPIAPLPDQPASSTTQPPTINHPPCLMCGHVRGEHRYVAPGIAGSCMFEDCMCGRYRDQPSTPGPRPAITLKTIEHRGDFDATVTIALEYQPGETVEELIARAGRYRSYMGSTNFRPADHIEIRVEQ